MIKLIFFGCKGAAFAVLLLNWNGTIGRAYDSLATFIAYGLVAYESVGCLMLAAIALFYLLLYFSSLATADEIYTEEDFATFREMHDSMGRFSKPDPFWRWVWRVFSVFGTFSLAISGHPYCAIVYAAMNIGGRIGAFFIGVTNKVFDDELAKI